MTGHDVIVVGAGPAGSTAARILADSGHDVLLLERAHFPREHIGESLLAYGNALLTRLGMDAELARFGVVKRGAEFTSDDGTHRRVDFEAQGAGRVLTTWNVERSLFDRAMLRAAAAAGATVLEGARVTRVRTDHSGRIVGVDYRTDDRQHSAHAPMVIDASGRAGVISHQHLRARKVNSRHSRIAIWSHVEGVSEADNPGVTGDIQVGDHRDGWVSATDRGRRQQRAARRAGLLLLHRARRRPRLPRCRRRGVLPRPDLLRRRDDSDDQWAAGG
jgi:flavin-dependent dehydrogenase